MAKYSTGRGGGGGDGDACELCGRETSNLRRANVAGANLLVCSNCAPHDDAQKTRGDARSGRQEGRDRSEPSRKKRAAQRAAKMYDAQRGDPKRWEEEGTSYEADRLPYLVSGYGSQVEQARQDAGFTAAELAAELGVDEQTILAVEQGRATRAGVGGSVIRGLESALDIELVDE
ncbi:helix-turn-helix domain-containing protein [Haloferacaceae archaeon DSL9]